MTEIYQDISRADSIPELKAVIVKHFGEFGMIRGRHGVWTVAEMLSFIDDFPHSLPTREYGIRQQLIYILYTTEKLQTK